MKRILLTICVLGIFACDSWKEVGVAGITPSPFIGTWKWEANDSWHKFTIYIATKGDSLLFAAGGVSKGGARVDMPEYDESGKIIAQARLLAPENGNKAVGRFNAGSRGMVTLELFSNSTMLFRSDAAIAAFPDSAVMVKASEKAPLFAE